MSAIRRILFAVRDPAAARQPGIDKAIAIAKSFGATLELFHALSSPVFVSVQPLLDEPIEALRARTEQKARARLEKSVVAARRHGVTLECSVVWDYPPHEAIVRRAAQIGADLIIAECHRGARTRPWLIHLTDWELLRASPLPVLLLKNGRPYRRPPTLAAVDPAHTHAKPLDLDSQILSAARQFSAALRGSLHVMHANHPSALALALGDPSVNAATIALTYDELTRE
jgi:universal stress protein E